ncbi:Uncharacterised protein [Actinomyces naeslundii]|nr:Uncharacterised protein [Actinomyces naeslundii]
MMRSGQYGWWLSDSRPAPRGDGVSALVRGQEAIFFTAIEHVERLDPADVQFVPDQLARYLCTRLWLDIAPTRARERLLVCCQTWTVSGAAGGQ